MRTKKPQADRYPPESRTDSPLNIIPSAQKVQFPRFAQKGAFIPALQARLGMFLRRMILGKTKATQRQSNSLSNHGENQI